MEVMKCPSWEGCAAPLCPIEAIQGACWYPDEEICNAKNIIKPSWVKTQRKIQRQFLIGRITDEYCFTLTMLEAIKAVRSPKGMRPEDMHRKYVDQTSPNIQIWLALPLK